MTKTQILADAIGARPVPPEVLLRVSNTLATIPTLDGQLCELVNETCSAVGAERGSIFLNDPSTGELYARVRIGEAFREIRMMNDRGIAGHVFTANQAQIVEKPYDDPRFNREVDDVTGLKTERLLAVPIRTVRGDPIGVLQILNKRSGPFDMGDVVLAQSMCIQASIVLQGMLFAAKTERLRQQEAEFLRVVSDVSSEIKLGPLLQKIMKAVTRMLDAERSTLFLNDERTSELYTEIGQGLGATQIRFPNSVGIAGAVFTSGESVNIPHAYADLRFNPEFDRKTAYFTRSILCVPVLNKDGKRIGVTQVLNKRGGAFTDEDAARLRAFTAQIAIGIENAQLFDDVQRMKNYSDSMFESMSNGVVTFSKEGRAVTCNAAARRTFGAAAAGLIGLGLDEAFSGPNAWVAEKVRRARETMRSEVVMDAELHIAGERRAVNFTALPMKSGDGSLLGSMILLEDISSEKRMKSTMSRYMDPALADQLLAAGGEALGGRSVEATILFSDIRSFTTLTEELGAQGTVSLLNEYFTIMVECIAREGGMLDKFIGDAIMAEFGLPVAHGDDPDRAMRAAIAMHTELAAWNRKRAGEGRKPVKMSVGLNTDIVVSGNIGSPRRMDYTVIGDGVNLASRLESASKQYGAKILVSGNTLAKVKDTYRTREIDLIVVKGKTEPVAVHEALDFHTPETFPNMVDVLGHFRDGLELYRAGQWDRAAAEFRKALAANPADACSELYVERCAYLKAHPPEGEWRGVWVMKEK